MPAAPDAVTLTLEADDGTTDAIAVPSALLDRLADDGAPAAAVVADVAVMALAGRAHALVHHGHGEPDPALEAAERAVLDAFEDRFGLTYGEATGHAH